MSHEPEFNSCGNIILNRIGQDASFWLKGRLHLKRMLDAIERLSLAGEFTKADLMSASGASQGATYDLLAKLDDYEKIDTIREDELRANASDVCPAPARYRLKPGADLSRFREIAIAYEYDAKKK
jgi:hypothetical protein